MFIVKRNALKYPYVSCFTV